jgi:UV DNA damage endonuclease
MNDQELVRFGYACINLSLKSKKITTNKTCRLATIDKYATSIDKYNFLTAKSLENLKHLKIIIQWHIDNNHHFYRLSSDMFPHISSPELDKRLDPEHLEQYRSLSFAKDILGEIGELAYRNNIRVTMHPGQYNQLGSPTVSVVEKTFVDLAWQAQIFEIMDGAIYKKFGISNAFINSILCIHGGGVYNDKASALNRWVKNFQAMPEYVRNRIALENCEKGYCVDDLLPVCNKLNIPLIFDFFHYVCYNHYHPKETQRSITELMPDILKTWHIRGMRPKFHLSNQAPNKCVGSHSDYVESVPDELLQLHQSGIPFDIMVEAKQKDIAMIYLMNKYPQLLSKPLTQIIPPTISSSVATTSVSTTSAITTSVNIVTNTAINNDNDNDNDIPVTLAPVVVQKKKIYLRRINTIIKDESELSRSDSFANNIEVAPKKKSLMLRKLVK